MNKIEPGIISPKLAKLVWKQMRIADQNRNDLMDENLKGMENFDSSLFTLWEKSHID